MCGGVVVATGRFQTLHVGSLDYLITAKGRAETAGARLCVLSGPADDELGEQAFKQGGLRRARRALRFAERQALIEVLSGIPRSHIFNHVSTPHQGPLHLDRYVENFFSEPIYAGVVTRGDLAGHHPERRVTLVTVKKASDIKPYRPGGEPRHFTDYLHERYAGLFIEDILDHCATRETQDGSLLPASLGELAQRMPPAALLAEMVASAGFDLSSPAVVTRLCHMHAKWDIPPQSLERLAGDLEEALYELHKRTGGSRFVEL